MNAAYFFAECMKYLVLSSCNPRDGNQSIQNRDERASDARKRKPFRYEIKITTDYWSTLLRDRRPNDYFHLRFLPRDKTPGKFSHSLESFFSKTSRCSVMSHHRQQFEKPTISVLKRVQAHRTRFCIIFFILSLNAVSVVNKIC